MLQREHDPVDKLIGHNIRIQRLSKGMSQSELARALGLTFQQVQKYEKGINRVGSSRLYKMASIFDIPVIALFEGAPCELEASGETVLNMISDRYAIRVVKALSRIKDSHLRNLIAELVERIAGDETAKRTSATQAPLAGD